MTCSTEDKNVLHAYFNSPLIKAINKHLTKLQFYVSVKVQNAGYTQRAKDKEYLQQDSDLQA
jgi:hypothetical protein